MRPFFLALALALGLFAPVHALTSAELKIEVRHALDDLPDPKVRYTDTMILRYLNEGQRDLVNRSWCLQTSTSQALTARTTYYALPTDLIAIQEVNFRETSTGRTRQLEEKSERALYQENADYERVAGAPYYYFVRHSTYGATQLEYGITPVPSSSTALGTVLIEYYNQPTDLSADTDVPLSGFRHLYPYHAALVNYAVGRIKLLEGDAAGASYLTLYENDVKLMIDRLGRMPNYNPGFSAGGK